MIKVTRADVEHVFDILNLLIFEQEGMKVPIPEHLDIAPLERYLGIVVKMQVGDGEFTTCVLTDTFKDWAEFVEIVAHEMIHVYQVMVLGTYGDHDEFFWSWEPIFHSWGLPLRDEE